MGCSAQGAPGARGPGGSEVLAALGSLDAEGLGSGFLEGWAAHPAPFTYEETEESEVKRPARGPSWGGILPLCVPPPRTNFLKPCKQVYNYKLRA